jgi:gliding motility-associated-like protein
LTTTSNYGGCQKTDTFTLFVTPPFSIHMPSPDTLLCNDTTAKKLVATFTDNTTGNNTSESAVWSIHNNLPGLSNDNGLGTVTFSPQVADTGKYYLVLTAGGQCIVKDSILFRVYPYKSPKFSLNDSIFCLTDPGLQIHTTTPGGIWAGPGISPNGIFSPQTAGVTNPYVTIQYLVNKGTPCADSSAAKMQVFNNPKVSFTTDTTEGCVPATTIWFSSTVLPNAATGTYMWYFSDGQTANTQNTSHTYSLQGVYSPKVVYVDANGCRDSVTHIDSITVHGKPNVSFYANPGTTDILSPHVDFINTTQPANCVWAWDIGGLDTSSVKNPSHNFDDPGTYVIQLTATNQYHCKGVYSIDLKINGAYALYVPSGFTPNGDGKNDLFKPDGFGLADNSIGYKMEVYDRWGQRLFETSDVNVGWDGTKNGTQLGQDVYVYSITFKDYEDRTHTQRGSVTLIR